MDLGVLERSHLLILREVQRLGSLTAAARQLCLTQSALSHAIRKLEDQLGAPVWVREGRRLCLTQAGLVLLALAGRLLPQFEHAEQVVAQMAAGQRGSLRIGIECHPCYAWLLTVVEPYLRAWPDVDVDVKQQFQFGGMAALFSYDIDMLVTPDPLPRAGLCFTPVFDYEQVLVVAADHPLAGQSHVEPLDLADQILISYPVEPERLDIFREFLWPAGAGVARRKLIETTDILLHMVAAGRGVAALPGWMLAGCQLRLPLVGLRLGSAGIHKQIHLGTRESDLSADYVSAFVDLAGQGFG